MDPHAAILDLLAERGAVFYEHEHAPVHTSEEAAKIRGLDPAAGAKSLLLKAGEDFVLAVLPGSERLDMKKLAAFLGVKKVRMATPEEVEQVMHCRIGACYPIGSVAGLRTLVDPSLLVNETIEFNPGSHTHSIGMSPAVYLDVAAPEQADIRVLPT